MITLNPLSQFATYDFVRATLQIKNTSEDYMGLQRNNFKSPPVAPLHIFWLKEPAATTVIGQFQYTVQYIHPLQSCLILAYPTYI